jgi:hypothetical protein
MRSITCMTAALAFCACSGQATAKAKDNAAAKPAAFQLNETTWTYVDKKTKVRESIDADGNYVENALNGKRMDYGKAVMKDGKVCFTSAMTKDGESCWTTSPVKIGHSMNTVSDKGEKLKVTRVPYVKLSKSK